MIRIKTENATYEVTLRIWTDGWNAGCSPDFLPDIWVDIGDNCEIDGDHTYLMSEDEFREHMDWWEDEVKRANDPDRRTEVLDNITDPLQTYMFDWEDI